MVTRVATKRKPAQKASVTKHNREIAAGEFKARCLAIIDEVNDTGVEVVITKRGKPAAKLVPVEKTSVDSLFGRLNGIVKIVGDPDDLVKPIIPLQDWHMLK